MFNLPANISFRGVDPNFRNPLVAKWNFTIQQDWAGARRWRSATSGRRAHAS